MLLNNKDIFEQLKVKHFDRPKNSCNILLLCLNFLMNGTVISYVMEREYEQGIYIQRIL